MKSPRIHKFLKLLLSHGVVVLLTSCGAGKAPSFPTDADVTPALDSIGERLFLDTRFAQYFAAHMTGVNQPLTVGDPVVAQVNTPNGPLPGPFAGQAMNCRSCHFVTEFPGITGAGNRTYSDFNGRLSFCNSMHMVGSLQCTRPDLLTFVEIRPPEDLVTATIRTQL